MRKSVFIALITILAIFSIRMLSQTIRLKSNLPRLKEIAEAQKYGKEAEEMRASLAEKKLNLWYGISKSEIPTTENRLKLSRRIDLPITFYPERVDPPIHLKEGS